MFQFLITVLVSAEHQKGIRNCAKTLHILVTYANTNANLVANYSWNGFVQLAYKFFELNFDT